MCRNPLSLHFLTWKSKITLPRAKCSLSARPISKRHDDFLLLQQTAWRREKPKDDIIRCINILKYSGALQFEPGISKKPDLIC